MKSKYIFILLFAFASTVFAGGPTVQKIYRNGALLKTGQLQSWHIGDDGDNQAGITPSYTVNTTGAQSGTSNVDVPHYAANTISFTAATKTISDAGNGLATILVGDKIRVRGSASNDGVYTVATGASAGSFTVTETIVTETASRYITLCKRATPVNATVNDNITGLLWSRTSSHIEKIGDASNGKLPWYDATKCYVLHPAGADLQMIASSKTLRIVGGAAEVTRYFNGMIIECTGFSNAVNNASGYRVDAVTVNGSDLDLTLWTGGAKARTLINESASGSRAIKIITRSIFAYCAAANAATLGGYSDWRIPEDIELRSLCNMEPGDAMPDSTAFPVWTAGDYYWSSVAYPGSAANAMFVVFNFGGISYSNKSTLYYCSLVRG